MNSPENNARSLRRVDLHIDHALASLRNAHPRAGLDRRILHALEERAASTHRSHTALRLIPSLPLAACLASGALALAILAALLLTHTHPAPRTIARTSSPSPQAPVASSTRLARQDVFAIRTPATTLSSRPEHRSLIAMRSGETCSSGHHGCPIHDDEVGSTVGMNKARALNTPTPSEATLLADLHAPSHPAPPLPLTPQEKALLRLLRYGNATQLASLADLNPAVRSARDAVDAADFQAFFNPPLPTQPGDTE